MAVAATIQSGCVIGSLCRTIANPVRGVLGLVAVAIEFAQRGWRGELLFGDKQHRSYRSGDRVKRSAVKSSTMKGPIEYVRKGLPVRFCEDWSRGIGFQPVNFHATGWINCCRMSGSF